MRTCEQLPSNQRPGMQCLTYTQKGFHQLWRVATVYGRAVQKSNAAADRLSLPLHEEMRVTGEV